MFPELAFDGLADMMSDWIREKGLVDHPGNETAPTEDIVSGRGKDMTFVISDRTMEICHKYNVVPIRYDEAVPLEANKDSGLRWLAGE